MATNISKYIQINDFILLEYEFNKSGDLQDLTNIDSIVAQTKLGSTQYFNEGSNVLGITNNNLVLNSEPTNSQRFSWYTAPSSGDVSTYWSYFDSSTKVTQSSYPFDTVKVHIVSGYDFNDVPGFLLQIQAKDTSDNLVDLSNFTWINQVLGNDVIKFSSNAL